MGDLIDHFKDHRSEFGFSSKEEYLEAADRFLGEPLSESVWQCQRRRNGDLLRYNPATEEFGILRNDGTIRTYMIADPARHRWPSNIAYFRWECGH